MPILRRHTAPTGPNDRNTAMMKRFLKNTAGNFALTFAIAAPVLFMCAGMATDYTLNRNAAKEMQEVLDAAVLSGAVEPGEQEEKLATARTFFNAQIAEEGGYLAAAKASFAFNGDNVLEGKAMADTPLLISGYFLDGPLQAGVTSAAAIAQKVKSVRFNPTDAQGWWEKKVRLMVVRPGVPEPEEIANVHYKVTGQKPPPKGTLSSDPDSWVDLGEYEKAYLEFTIGPKAYEFEKHCPGCPMELRSDDPETSNRFVIDGTKVPKGTVLDIFDFAKCNTKSSQSWEDGGGGIPDIYYKIEAKCGLGDGNDAVHLIK